MKILLVTASFFPEISPRSFRMTELCKQFCRDGHEVTLVTPITQDRSQLAQEFGFELIDLRYPFPGIQLKGSNRLTSEVRRWINRGLQLFFEYPDIVWAHRVRQAIRDLDGFDLMVSCAVPHPVHWGVALARGKAKRIARVWVADCGDPFMMSYFDTFRHPFYFAIPEKFFCRRADYIAVPAISLREKFYPEFSNKVVEIPQGINPQEFPIYSGELPAKPICFAYAGLFIPRVRDPSAFLEYLSQRTDVDFVFNAYTATPQHIQHFKDRLGEKLQIKAPIPRQEVIYELSKHHFLVNIGFDPKSTLPSKLMDYWLAGRPILGLDNYNHLDQKKVDAFLAGDYSAAFKVENPDRFRIDRVAAKFVELGQVHHNNCEIGC